MIMRKPITSVLFLLIFTGLLFGGIIALASHEMAVNSKEFGDVSPANWNADTFSCDEGYERIGSHCISEDDFHNSEERRFFEELNNLEVFFRKQRLYSCSESPRVALSNSEVKAFFSANPDAQFKKLKNLVVSEPYMKTHYVINDQGDVTYNRELEPVWHSE